MFCILLLNMFELIISLVILLVSVILHEVAHGFAAYIQGDMTARDEGRLTLNPISHVDPLGTLILPSLLIALKSGFIFGWAKPVPYNPYNLKWGARGEAFVASAGAITNIALALLSALLFSLFGGISGIADFIFTTTVFINILLAVINLVPVPPLDGYKILTQVLPLRLRTELLRFEADITAQMTSVGMLLMSFLVLYLFLDPILGFVKYISAILLHGGLLV